MVLPISSESPPTLHKGMGNTNPEPQEGQRDNGVKSMALLPSQNTPFHSSITVLTVSSLTHNHPFPSFKGDSMSGKANTSVKSGVVLEAPDDGCLDGVDEPQ